MSTCTAAEDRLTGTVRSFRVATGRTTLAGVLGWYDNQLAAIPGALIGQLQAQLIPSPFQDGTIEPSLLADVATRHCDRSSSTGAHVLHAQILDHDLAVVLRPVGREVVLRVANAVRDPPAVAVQAPLRPDLVARPALLARDPSLEYGQTAAFLWPSYW